MGIRANGVSPGLTTHIQQSPPKWRFPIRMPVLTVLRQKRAITGSLRLWRRFSELAGRLAAFCNGPSLSLLHPPQVTAFVVADAIASRQAHTATPIGQCA